MTKEQKYYYSALNDKNKKYIILLLTKLYPEKYFPALNDDAIDYIKQFQKNNYLEVDGIAGKYTVEKMEKKTGSKKQSPVVEVKKTEPEKPKGQQEQPAKVIDFPQKKADLNTNEQRLQNFIKDNFIALFFIGVFGLWARKR